MPELQLILSFFQQQPFLAYALLAALILAVVSVLSGLSKLDFLGALSPQGLLTLTLSALLAWLIVSQGHIVTQFIPFEGARSDGFLAGLSRFPLYLGALAYGSSAGLFAGALFLSFTLNESSSLWFELILLLELAVVGWFALSPSPRLSRWAGPVGAVLAYALTWATAGSAFLQWESKSGSSLAAHMVLHEGALLGLGVSCCLLLLLGPRSYEAVFKHSRIVPFLKPSVSTGASEPIVDSARDKLRPTESTRVATRVRHIEPINPALDLPSLASPHPKRTRSLAPLKPLANQAKRKPKRQLSQLPLEDLR